MSNGEQYLAVIPARGGSKGIHKKNIQLVAGLPLIAWSIKQALACKNIKHVIVSTDDEEIATISREYGAEVPFLRPSELAQDSTPTEPVLIHTLNYVSNNYKFKPYAVILLQPTSPLRHKNTINGAIDYFESKQLDSLLSVSEGSHFYWKNKSDPVALYDYRNRLRRQDIAESEIWYRENGSIYITKPDILAQHNNRLAGKIGIYKITEEEGVEVDTEIDLVIASILTEKYT